MATTSKMEKYLSRKKKQGSVARNWKKKKKKGKLYSNNKQVIVDRNWKKKKKGKLKTKKLSKITIDRTKAEEIEEICIHQNLVTGHHSNNIWT